MASVRTAVARRPTIAPLLALLVLPLLLSELVLAPGPASAAALPPPRGAEPVRVLLLGDSVTQGSSGDWTWRYRLWQHIRAAGIDVDFVGPAQDLWDLETRAPGSMAYADARFDRDHAAGWGMALAWPEVPIDRLVEEYRPDVMVEMLGVNDLLFTDEEPRALAQRFATMVRHVRQSAPDLEVVLGEVTQHWFPDASAFNAALAGVAEELTTPRSRVVVAEVSAGYDADTDTWDNSHPNARGEVKIAAAVADALHALRIGPAASRPLLLPHVGPRTPATLTGAAGDGAVQLSWSASPGATGQLLWRQGPGAGQPWVRDAEPLPARGSVRLPAVNGGVHRFRLQPVKGDDAPEGEVFSSVVSLRPGLAPGLAVGEPPRPVTAPQRLRAVAVGSRCVRLVWRRVSGATSYRIQRRVSGAWGAAVITRQPRWRGVRLPARRAWRFRVQALHGAERGPAATISVVRPRAGGCR